MSFAMKNDACYAKIFRNLTKASLPTNRAIDEDSQGKNKQHC